MYWRTYGDINMIDDYYNDMLAYCVYITKHSVGNIVSDEEGYTEEISFLGDWLTVGKTHLPPDFINTCIFIKLICYLAEMSDALKRGDSSQLAILANRCCAALREKYMDTATGSFFNGVQGADAFAYDAGIGDSRTLKRLIDRYTALEAIDTGIVGTPVLIDTLCANGQTALAIQIFTAKNDNSVWNMMLHGATTVWETWNYDINASICHPAFGACVVNLFHDVIGIQPLAPGYSKVVIRPDFADKLKFMRGSILTPHGRISVGARRTASGAEITVDIDGNTAGTLQYISESIELHRGRNVLKL